MDPFFQVEVLQRTQGAERLMYRAMHQDYSSAPVSDDDPIPADVGGVIVKHLLSGDKGHYGPLEHPQITFACKYFPHSVSQQARTHRVGVSFDIQSFRYTGTLPAELGRHLLDNQATSDDVNRVFCVPAAARDGQAITREGVKTVSPDAYHIIMEQYRNQAMAYYRLTQECGLPEEDARCIIGYGIRQHFVVSFNARSFLHFVDLRAKKDAQGDIRDLCDLMWPHFRDWCPSVAQWYESNRYGKAKLAP